jgi:hypothetical protein
MFLSNVGNDVPIERISCLCRNLSSEEGFKDLQSLHLHLASLFYGNTFNANNIIDPT